MPGYRNAAASQASCRPNTCAATALARCARCRTAPQAPSARRGARRHCVRPICTTPNRSSPYSAPSRTSPRRARGCSPVTGAAITMASRGSTWKSAYEPAEMALQSRKLRDARFRGQCRRRDSNPRHADYDSARLWLSDRRFRADWTRCWTQPQWICTSLRARRRRGTMTKLPAGPDRTGRPRS